MPRASFSDSFNDIHELKYGQAEEKLEAGGDEKLIFNFIWPYSCFLFSIINNNYIEYQILYTISLDVMDCIHSLLQKKLGKTHHTMYVITAVEYNQHPSAVSYVQGVVKYAW